MNDNVRYTKTIKLWVIWNWYYYFNLLCEAIKGSVLYCSYCPHKLNTRFSLSHISFCSVDVSLGKRISDKLGWHSEINDDGNKFNCLSPETVWESALFRVSFSNSLLQWSSSSINLEWLFIINNVATKRAFPLKRYAPFKGDKIQIYCWCWIVSQIEPLIYFVYQLRHIIMEQIF